jgi:hypothetical protein
MTLYCTCEEESLDRAVWRAGFESVYGPATKADYVMNEWMNEWMNGWMTEWRDKWMTVLNTNDISFIAFLQRIHVHVY